MPAPLLALLPVLAPILHEAITRAVPDPEAQARVQAEINSAMLVNASKLEEASASIIQTESKGESWLQRNWRPVTMMTFLALISARWLGFSPPGMSEAEVLAAWNLMELGLGGYVIGRSAEKALPSIVELARSVRR